VSVFGRDYSSYYDLFYADKDYAAEAAFVRTVIERHRPGAHSLIELGCGSARHAVEFVRAGFAVTGIDRSAEMIARGRDRLEQLSPDLRDHLILQQGDATTYKPAATYDAVIALFHVVSYQTTNEALNAIFGSARSALQPGGLFVFDFWYGPAVLAEGPSVRVRRIETSDLDVTRTAEPTHERSRNVVTVKYTFLAVHRNSSRTERHEELHPMRYLFLPEIEGLVATNRFEVVEVGEWMTGKDLGPHCWSGYAALRAVAGRA